jgi:hypothetical protein
MPTPSVMLRVLISALSATLFIIFSMPIVYSFVNGLTKSVGFEVLNKNGCPSGLGIMVHAILFGIVIFLLMF